MKPKRKEIGTMIKEALDFLKTSFQAEQRPVLLPIDENTVLLTTKDGSKEIKKPFPVRSHSVETLPGFIAAAAKWGEKGVVWHTEDGLLLTCSDEEYRRDLVSLALKQSPEFELLRVLEAQKDKNQMTQRELLKMLTRQLERCVPNSVVSAIRVITFNRGASGRAAIDHGKETLGHTIEAQVNSTENLPEQFLATIPIYDLAEFSIPVDIKLYLDVNVETQGFVCYPAPGALDRAVRNMQATIHERLEKDLPKGYPVFQGEP
jgi:hypothetical protein